MPRPSITHKTPRPKRMRLFEASPRTPEHIKREELIMSPVRTEPKGKGRMPHILAKMTPSPEKRTYRPGTVKGSLRIYGSPVKSEPEVFGPLAPTWLEGTPGSSKAVSPTGTFIPRSSSSSPMSWKKVSKQQRQLRRDMDLEAARLVPLPPSPGGDSPMSWKKIHKQQQQLKREMDLAGARLVPLPPSPPDRSPVVLDVLPPVPRHGRGRPRKYPRVERRAKRTEQPRMYTTPPSMGPWRGPKTEYPPTPPARFDLFRAKVNAMGLPRMGGPPPPMRSPAVPAVVPAPPPRGKGKSVRFFVNGVPTMYTTPPQRPWRAPLPPMRSPPVLGAAPPPPPRPFNLAVPGHYAKLPPNVAKYIQLKQKYMNAGMTNFAAAQKAMQQVGGVQAYNAAGAKKAAGLIQKGAPAKSAGISKAFISQIKNAKPGSMIATRIGMIKVPAKKKKTATKASSKTKKAATKKKLAMPAAAAAVPAASLAYQQKWHPRTFERPGKVTKKGTRAEYSKDISGVGWRSTPTSFVKASRTQPWWRWAALRGIARGGKSEISSAPAVRKQIRYQLGVGPQQLYRMTEHRPYQSELFKRLGRTRARKAYEKKGYSDTGFRPAFPVYKPRRIKRRK